jgi:HK97 family phage prohead protease
VALGGVPSAPLEARGDSMFFHDLALAGDAGFETKSLAEGADVASFTGVASTAKSDRVGDVIEAGAFGSIVPKTVKMFRDHMREHLIGGWKKFSQEGDKLMVEGVISLLTEKGRETYTLMKQGFLDGLSVGFIPEPGGVVWNKDRRIIKKAALVECSVCALPCNSGARVSSVKSLSADDTKQWLRENGFPDNEIELLMTKGFDALRESRPPGRLNITEIDEFTASGGRDSDDEKRLAALASGLKAILHDVRERRLP